jgi:hypothetical protein
MFRRMVLGVVVLGAAACATVTTGTRESIQVDSKPSGATATMTCENGFRAVETTPVTISVARDAGECSVRLTKEGFEEGVVAVSQGVNPAYFLNLWTAAVPWFVLSQSWDGNLGAAHAAVALTAGTWIVDGVSGARHRHRPDRIDRVLTPMKKQ